MAFDLKNYEEVKDRIPLFYAAYPDGRIITDVMSDTDKLDTCVVKATLFKNAEEQNNYCPLATGLAFEKMGSTPVNRTSHLENCETSAIGRALANLNMKKSTAPRPSREEMEKVQRMESEANKTAITKVDVDMMTGEISLPEQVAADAADDEETLGEFAAKIAAAPYADRSFKTTKHGELTLHELYAIDRGYVKTYLATKAPESVQRDVREFLAAIGDPVKEKPAEPAKPTDPITQADQDQIGHLTELMLALGKNPEEISNIFAATRDKYGCVPKTWAIRQTGIAEAKLDEKTEELLKGEK
jgi:hypothetical protein